MRRLALIALLAPLLLATPAWAQEPAVAPTPPAPMADHNHAMAPGMAMGGAPAAGPSMMAKMDAANAQLATLTDAMNKASGSKKMDAMAAVVNALIQDRLAMQAMMHDMHAGQGEMGSMGGMKGCPPGMECCKGEGMACGPAAAAAPAKAE